MKYYTAVKKECHRYTSVGEDLQDVIDWKKPRVQNRKKAKECVCIYVCVHVYTHIYIILYIYNCICRF